MKTLEIIDLHVSVENKEILKGVNLKLQEGETLALLGPNGHGKSTLLQAIMGNPHYQVTQGQIILNGKDITNQKINERSCEGIFLAMQTPPEVPGVINSDFLKSAINARRESPIRLYEFYRQLENASKTVKMSMDMASRFLNEGFSGGEKKRNEILQMILLNPDFAMLDEIDSGLDVDAIKIVSSAISDLQKKQMSFLVVSHYARLYNLIHPTKVAVMINGKIIVEGDDSLITRIDQEGYEWIKYELGVEIEKEDSQMSKTSLGVCATKEITRGQ